MGESLDTWFAHQVLPHEAALVRYLKRTWRNHDEVHDLRQEIYIRVYESAARTRPLSPKSFLFTVARNLMADRVRRRRIVSIEATGDMDALNVSIDEISPERIASAHQDLRRLAEAFDRLPPKCRDVMWMRKVEGLSQREVAARMGVAEGAVEKHITKGVRLLAQLFFSGTGTEGGRDSVGSSGTAGVGHGKQHKD